MLKFFKKFIAVTPKKPGQQKPGGAFFRRHIRNRRTGETMQLQRIVPLSGGGMRAYYLGRKSGIRAVDRNGVTRVVKQTKDKVWLS